MQRPPAHGVVAVTPQHDGERRLLHEHREHGEVLRPQHRRRRDPEQHPVAGAAAADRLHLGANGDGGEEHEQRVHARFLRVPDGERRDGREHRGDPAGAAVVEQATRSSPSPARGRHRRSTTAAARRTPTCRTARTVTHSRPWWSGGWTSVSRTSASIVPNGSCACRTLIASSTHRPRLVAMRITAAATHRATDASRGRRSRSASWPPSADCARDVAVDATGSRGGARRRRRAPPP